MKREPWHDSLLASLAALADRNLQVRAWIQDDKSVFLVSPTELICQVFDDSAILELMETGIVFSQEADRSLRELHSLTDLVDLEVSPDQLMTDPGWARLTEAAKQAYDSVLGSLR